MVDITFNGMTMEFDVVESMMDADIKASIKDSLGECTEQELLDAYMQAHKEKYGTAFLQSE
jgi:hypothetical protein